MKRIFALTLCCVLFLSACGTAPAEPSVPELLEPIQPQPKTATVQREELLSATSTIGNVALYAEAVTFTADGTLGEAYVIPGQEVKKGDVLAVLDMKSTEEQLESLLEQQERTGYVNALTLENLQTDVDICQLKLDRLTQTHQAALAERELTLSTLREALAQLLGAGAAAVEAMEQELAQLRQELSELPAEDLRIPVLEGEIFALESRIVSQQQSDAASEAAANIQIQELEAQINEVKAQQALEKRLYELDLEDAKLARKHTGQTQYLAAQKLAGQIQVLEEKLTHATITAPMDGTVIWISSSKKISSEKAYLYIADMNRPYLRTEELSDYKLTNAQEIYAIIGDQKYPVTYTPLDIDEKLYRSLNKIPVYSYYAFDTDARISLGENALLFCVHNYKEDALCIPKEALRRDSNGYYVYKQEGGQRKLTRIQVGITTELRAEVLSGLEEGDVVYVAD